ncbi:hypothetical protein LINPERHAP2_LOCUS13713 [Linum perenne]
MTGSSSSDGLLRKDCFLRRYTRNLRTRKLQLLSAITLTNRSYSNGESSLVH